MGQLEQAPDLPVHPVLPGLHRERDLKGPRDQLTQMDLDHPDLSTPMDPEIQGLTVVRTLLAVALSNCHMRTFRRLVLSATE